MSLILPKLKAVDAIVDKMGRPTLAFLRYFNFDFARAIERNEATQAQIISDLQQVTNDLALAQQDILDTQDDLQDQIDRLNDILAGTGEPFTGLNVGGTNVKPFLDKTDGTKLTTSTGLDAGVVVTATVLANSTNLPVSVSGGPVGWTSESDERVLASAADVAVARGATHITADLQWTLTTQAFVRIYRDGTEMYERTVASASRESAFTYLDTTVTPGLHTYELRLQPDGSAIGTVETATMTLIVLSG